jgi:DNA uptake protein ComE-like DNA-binding protein
MKLKGVGKKRAEALAQVVRERRRAVMMDDDDDFPAIKDLEELGMIKGIGQNMVENMRSGLSAAS